MTSISVPALLSNVLLFQPVAVGWRRDLTLLKSVSISDGQYPLSPIGALADHAKAILNRFEVNFTSPSNFPRAESLHGLAIRGSETLVYLIDWATNVPAAADYLISLQDMKAFFDEAQDHFSP